MRRGWAHRETHAQLWGVGRVSSCCTGSVDAQARRGACDAAATVRGRRSVRGCGVVEWWSGRKPRRRAAAVLMRQARARRRRDALPRAAPPPLPPPDSTLRPRAAAHQPARRAARACRAARWRALGAGLARDGAAPLHGCVPLTAQTRRSRLALSMGRPRPRARHGMQDKARWAHSDSRVLTQPRPLGSHSAFSHTGSLTFVLIAAPFVLPVLRPSADAQLPSASSCCCRMQRKSGMSEALRRRACR
jgi:hypothetical protein